MIALKNVPSLIGGAAVIAGATLGLSAAIASAKYDDDNYWRCVINGRDKESCCITWDGEWDAPSKSCGEPAKMTQVPDAPETPPQVANGTLPTVATNAPVTSAPGSRAPGRLPSGGVAAP